MIRAANNRFLSALRSFGRRYLHSARGAVSGGVRFAGRATPESNGGIRSDSEAPESNGGIGLGFMTPVLLVTRFLHLAQQALDDSLRIDPVAAGIVVGDDPMLQHR